MARLPQLLGWQIMQSILHGSSLLLGFASFRSIVGETVLTLYLSTSYARTSERFLDFDGLQCAELSSPARYLVGGDRLYLHFEA